MRGGGGASSLTTRRKAPGEGLASLDEVSVTDQLSTRPFFSLDLLFTGNIAAVPVANADVALASNDLAAFVAAAPTLQQRRQLAFSVGAAAASPIGIFGSTGKH